MSKLIALMMMVAAAPSRASDSEVFGQWLTYTMPGVWYAYTQSESGDSFGLTCDETCNYYVHLRGPCPADRTYDVVVSSQFGSIPSRVTCYPDHEWRYLVFEDRRVETLIAGDAIAIRSPSEDLLAYGGTFSLDGANEAIAALAQQWTPPKTTPARNAPAHSSSAHSLLTAPPPVIIHRVQ